MTREFLKARAELPRSDQFFLSLGWRVDSRCLWPTTRAGFNWCSVGVGIVEAAVPVLMVLGYYAYNHRGDLTVNWDKFGLGPRTDVEGEGEREAQ